MKYTTLRHFKHKLCCFSNVSYFVTLIISLWIEPVFGRMLVPSTCTGWWIYPLVVACLIMQLLIVPFVLQWSTCHSCARGWTPTLREVHTTSVPQARSSGVLCVVCYPTSCPVAGMLLLGSRHLRESQHPMTNRRGWSSLQPSKFSDWSRGGG